MTEPIDDLEWLLMHVDRAIARFHATGQLAQYNPAFAQWCGAGASLNPQIHYHRLLDHLAARFPHPSNPWQPLLHQMEKLLTGSADGAVPGITLILSDGQTQSLQLRRLATGDVLWVLSPPAIAPAPSTPSPEAPLTARPPNSSGASEFEAFAHAVLDAIPDPVFVKNAQGQFVWCNQAFLQTFGFSARAAILGKTDHDLFPKTQADLCQAQDQLTFQTNRPTFNEEEITDAQGQKRWYFLAKQNFQDQSGQPFLVGIAHDVQRRRQAELALQASEMDNRALLLAIPDMLMRIGRDGYVDYLKLSASVTPYPVSVNHSLPTIFDCLPPAQAEQRMAAVQAALASGHVQTYEQQLNIAGRMIYEEVRVSPCGDNEVLVMVRNVSDRKQAEAEIHRSLIKTRELDQLKLRFLEMVSHEFRTPLTQIQVATDLLRYLPADATEQEDYFEHIQQGIVQMTRMMNDIIQLQYAMETSDVADVRSTNVEHLCQTIILELSREMGRQIALRVPSSLDCRAIHTDAYALRQVLWHLMANAVQYSQPDTEITVQLVQQNNELHIHIIDHGIGIPPTDRPHLFDYFYRGSNIGNLPGTGLGLAIAKYYVTLIRGRIELIDPPHPGTCFVLALPLSVSTPVPTTAPEQDGL